MALTVKTTLFAGREREMFVSSGSEEEEEEYKSVR
jgi:hypothetical protein